MGRGSLRCLSLAHLPPPPPLPPHPAGTGPPRPAELLALPTLEQLYWPPKIMPCPFLKPVHSLSGRTPGTPQRPRFSRLGPFYICLCSLFGTWHHGHSINIFHVATLCQVLSPQSNKTLKGPALTELIV